MKKLSIIILISLSLLLSSCFKKEEAKVVENNSGKTQELNFDNSIDFIVEDGSGKIIVKNTGSLNKLGNKINEEKKENIVKIITNTGVTQDNKSGSGETQSNSGDTEELENKIKLINASISNETEYLTEEEKEFMKNEIDELDTSTFVRFKNSIYSKDKNNVYFLVFGLNKLLGVNPNTFKVLQPDGYYWTDGTGIYLLEKKIEDMDFPTLKFAKINDTLTVGGDKNNLYIGSRLVIKGGDINSISALSENCIKDNLHVYCSFADFGTTKEGDSYEIVEGVDLDTYAPYDYFYAKDKNNIYFEGFKVEGALIDSFKVYNNSLFAKDELNAYYEGEIISGIKDIESFIAINGIPQDNTCFYKIEPDFTAICEEENNN
ncbi:hypothetical protein EOM39_05855 [Candidatus Gracilibacteria bacterium]|nr:hypothetical protein [Candidatus Gracilibacteria bacterium]